MACRLPQTPLTPNPFLFKEQFLSLNCELLKPRNQVSCLHFYPQGQASNTYLDEWGIDTRVCPFITQGKGGSWPQVCAGLLSVATSGSNAAPGADAHPGAVFARCPEVSLGPLWAGLEPWLSVLLAHLGLRPQLQRVLPGVLMAPTSGPWQVSRLLATHRSLGPQRAAHKGAGESILTRETLNPGRERQSTHPTHWGMTTRHPLHGDPEGGPGIQTDAHSRKLLSTAPSTGFSSFPGTPPKSLSRALLWGIKH